MSKNKFFVAINKQVPMSAGKIASQVSHAIARLNPKVNYDTEQVTAVTVSVKDTATLQTLIAKLRDSEIKHAIQVDAGYTEVPKGYISCVAFHPKDPLLPFIKRLRLYR